MEDKRIRNLPIFGNAADRLCEVIIAPDRAAQPMDRLIVSDPD
jgi:hypothetical protein